MRGGRALLCLALASFGARAAEGVAPDLYQDMVIVTGFDMRSRPAGFARALLDVLVKVSGDPRLAADPRAAAISRHAGALVAGFDYADPMAHRRPHDDQGSYDRSYDLTVRFAPAGVDAALRSLGAKPWAGARPVVVPLIAVQGREKPWVGTYLLTADGAEGAAQRASLANAAARYGLVVVLPTEAELAARGVRLGDVPPERSTEEAGSVSVVGSIEYRPDALGWVAAWRTRAGSVDHRSSVSGVSFDAVFDRMVGEVAVLGSGSGVLQ